MNPARDSALESAAFRYIELGRPAERRDERTRAVLSSYFRTVAPLDRVREAEEINRAATDVFQGLGHPARAEGFRALVNRIAGLQTPALGARNTNRDAWVPPLEQNEVLD